MPTQARTTDEIADNIRSLVDRLVDAQLTRELARRGQELAEVLAERGSELGERAEEAWRDSAPARRRAAMQMARGSRDAAKWSERTWRRTLRPAVRDLWSRRAVAVGAAAGAVPVGKELIDEAAARLGVKRREERHWGAFFVGLLIGIAAGAIAALLAAPKPGRQVREQLTARAGEMADEIASRAREAEWVPLFQREPIETMGAASAGAAAGAASAAIGSTPTDADMEPAMSPETPAVGSDIPGPEVSASMSEAIESSQPTAENAAAEAGETGETAVVPEPGDYAADEAAAAINDAFGPTDAEREQ